MERRHGYELLDVTWDSGALDGTAFHRRYETTWLFVPPAEFIATHLPDDARWALGAPLDALRGYTWRQ